MNCIFCKIISGDLPSNKLYSDNLVTCFLDIAPINLGHALIIPNEHHAGVTTVPSEILGRMMEVAPTIAQAIVREVDADGFNFHLSNGQCAGQVVLHSHLHIIPRSPTDGFSWGWRSLAYENDNARQELSGKISVRLKNKNM